MERLLIHGKVLCVPSISVSLCRNVYWQGWLRDGDCFHFRIFICTRKNVTKWRTIFIQYTFIAVYGYFELNCASLESKIIVIHHKNFLSKPAKASTYEDVIFDKNVCTLD